MWNYNKKVMDHFLNPRNVGEVENPDGFAEVGNVSCGDALKLTFKLDKDGRIVDVKFKTFGCASAIASSSALTELVKGKTLEEASKITNKDIVDYLGELPEEKKHCSVMGMEALQSAIANYRGEQVADDHGDDDGRVVCKCFGVTESKIRRVIRENSLTTTAEVTNYCKAGGACTSCLDDIQKILDDELHIRTNGNAKPAEPGFSEWPVVRKVVKVQEVIDREIVPLLEKDGGSMELVDIVGNSVRVRLQGRCSGCPASGVTLKNLVEDKLREFVSPEILVEQV
ncbi:MAG: Fe-S cluster assembly protein NifU [Victivallaceae bacterium]|nr:Fe-S cluster assembly protein NifU [Victivallaceae bacterium]